MPVLGSHPVITIIVLFIVFFSIFFLLIYGTLRYAEGRKSRRGEESPEEEVASQSQVPTYARYKTCPKCGTNMPGVASFCPECGAAQIPA